MYIPHQGRMYIALWGGAFIEVMNAIEAKRRIPLDRNLDLVVLVRGLVLRNGYDGNVC